MTRDVLGAVDRLVEEGRLAEAVDRLAAENREHPESGLEIALLDLRRRAAQAVQDGPGRSPWPPPYTDPFPGPGIPEIRPSELTVDVLGGAVAHHGCLLVRGVLDEAHVARTVAAIDRTQATRDQRAPEDRDPAWYRSFPAPASPPDERKMVAGQGGTWLADSPASTALVLDELAEAGLIDAIGAHFGERPFFSLQKSTLRRSRPINKLTAWHQDGSFLGSEVRTMNVWLALSRCGADYPAPGLEVVPKRMETILPTEGNLVRSSISFDLVADVATDAPAIRPEFRPGDALLFDERFLHRTYLDPYMTEDRYAVECWFFAPSHATDQYVSFLA